MEDMRNTVVLIFCLFVGSVAWAQATAGGGNMAQPAKAGAAADRAAAAEDVNKAEQDRCDAVLKGDVDFLDKQTAPGYTMTSFTGAVSSKKQMVDGFKSGANKFTDYKCTDLKSRIYGNAAVTIGMAEASGTLNGQAVTNQKFRFTRVWVKRDGEWKSVAYQQTVIQ